jgi:hypothetical protein
MEKLDGNYLKKSLEKIIMRHIWIFGKISYLESNSYELRPLEN